MMAADIETSLPPIPDPTQQQNVDAQHGIIVLQF